MISAAKSQVKGQTSGKVFFDDQPEAAKKAFEDVWAQVVAAAEVEDTALENLQPSLASAMFNNLDQTILEGLLGLSPQKVFPTP